MPYAKPVHIDTLVNGVPTTISVDHESVTMETPDGRLRRLYESDLGSIPGVEFIGSAWNSFEYYSRRSTPANRRVRGAGVGALGRIYVGMPDWKTTRYGRRDYYTLPALRDS